MAVRRPPGPAPTTTARFLVDDELRVALEEDGGSAPSVAAASGAVSAAARLKGLKDTMFGLGAVLRSYVSENARNTWYYS